MPLTKSESKGELGLVRISASSKVKSLVLIFVIRAIDLSLRFAKLLNLLLSEQSNFAMKCIID